MQSEDPKPASIHISVPPSLREYVDGRVSTGGFGSTSDYVRALIRADQKEHAREQLEARLLRALESPSEEMTRADWADIRREVSERIEAKKESR
jgi:antitoxin ParD1/3/4